MEDQKLITKIRHTEDEVRKIYESQENKRRLQYWSDSDMSNDYFRALPRDVNVKPFTVYCERPQLAKLLDFNFYEYYHNPYIHYLIGLQTQIFQFKSFNDCTPVVKRRQIDPSGAFERSIFVGDDAVYTEHDAAISDIPAIKEYSDLDRMQVPDFYTSGNMPQIIRFYEDIRSIASDDFSVSFPVWGRSAWGCAWQMRRLTNLMYDLCDEPEWVDRLLRFFNESRKSWSKQRSQYLGEPIGPTNIYNDEVLHPVVGPSLYEEKILPLEIDLSEFYGGVRYWHSCGDTTQLFGLIDRIPNTELITVSCFSDVELAGKTYSPDKILEVQLHPNRDVLDPISDTVLPERLELIRQATANHKSFIVGCGLVFFKGYEDGMRRVRDLCETAHKALNL